MEAHACGAFSYRRCNGGSPAPRMCTQTNLRGARSALTALACSAIRGRSRGTGTRYHERHGVVHPDRLEHHAGVRSGEDPEDLVAESLARDVDAREVERDMGELRQTGDHAL